MKYQTLHAGVARTDLTPPLGVHLFGYPLQDRCADSIADPLHSTALVLARGDVEAAVISVDWIMVQDEDVAAIQSEVEQRTGIPSANVTVCAIQTHTAPATMAAWGWGNKNTDYVNEMLPRIADSVAQAHAALRPARVGIGTTQSDVGVNRRGIAEDGSVGLGYNPWGPYDPEMTVLRFETDEGSLATVVHYGAHPTALGPQRFVSRDWPGVMVDRIETITGAPALYINGAVGDVAPRSNIHSATGDSTPAAMEVGHRAALDALRAYDGIRTLRDEELSVYTEQLLLPYAPLPSLEEARAEMQNAEPQKAAWGTGMCNFRYWQAVVEAHDAPTPAGLLFQQTITRLGPLAIVPFAGEPFTEIVLRLRELSPFQYTLCASTTNGRQGYYATRESRARGGYEVWVARSFGAHILADDIDDVLVRENLRLLRQLHSE